VKLFHDSIWGSSGVTRWRYGLCAPLALGAAIWLAATAPASADFFGFRDQPRFYWNGWQPFFARPHHKRHRQVKREERVPPREERPQGPFQIVVEIATQQVEIYGQNGFIARAPISTGMSGHPTPTGVFTVLSKSRWHESNIYSGAPMPYMQRITWSGIALHAGPRPGYPASHGCIRLPEDFAIWLFHTTKVGARVIVTREPAPPADIVSAKLFVPAPRDLDPTKVAMRGTAPPPLTAAPAPTDTTGKITPPAEQKPAAPPKPISVFVSRKQGKVFVRQGFTELFDMPVTIADPDRPLGTHVYTAMALTDDGKALRWNVISIPSGYRHHVAKHRSRNDAETDVDMPTASTASEAIDRITLPPEAVEKISALISPGSALIVSDNALSGETDASTDFIVLTP
jgi:hypothetical protein